MKALTKKTLGLAGILILTGTITRAAEPVIVKKITFNEAREITWQNSHILKQSALMQQRRSQEKRAARGLYYPSVGITAQAMLMQEDIRLDLTPVEDAITPLYQTLGTYGKFGGITGIPDEMATALVRQKILAGLNEIEKGDWNRMIQERDFGVVTATVEWPVYAGGRIRAANKAASIQLREATEADRQKQGELMSELAERYYGLCLARQVVAVRQTVLSGLQQHLDDALKLETEGMIAHSDVLHARVFHAQANRELSKALDEAATVNKALTSTLVLSDTVTVEPASDLFYLDSIEPLAYFQSLAASHNPLLDQIESKKELARQACKAEQAAYFPAVLVQGAYNLADKNLSPYMPGWEAGVGLKWNLFDGLSKYAKVRAARLQVEEAGEFGQKSQSDISTLVEKKYREIRMYHDQLAELAEARNYAEEYLRTCESEFRHEMSQSTRVVDARLALAQVNTERLQAMYHYDTALAKLLEYSGIPGDFPSYINRPGVKTERYQ